ncbi:MAG: TIGR04255 family protein [Verrucomicrobia bacterium]|nr:TIGR04255 family protein [Verrucomicrobiota bacterium]
MTIDSNCRKNYKKAPIIEAMLDLRFAPESGFDFFKLETSIPQKLSINYPNVKKLVHSEFRVDISNNPVHSYEILRLSSEDGNKILQLRSDGFFLVNWLRMIVGKNL